jgi:hypothetical protein
MRYIFCSSAFVVLAAAFAIGLALAQNSTTDSTAPDVKQQDAAQSTTTESISANTTVSPRTSKRPAPRKLPAPKGARRLSPDFDVWVDPKEGVVIVDGEICLREGMLEMFACTRNTKEHEAIVSANTRAYLVHAGLVALGAVPGHPVQFVPEYKPPAGTEIEVLVQYIDEDGNEETVRAQEWIKDIRTKKPMSFPFVFGGSTFWTDPDTGKKYYQAERGDFICVSNFGTAMLDIPVQSSAENDSLGFQTMTDRIPPLWTPVRLLLKPKLKKPAAEAGERAAKPVGGKVDTGKPEPRL